jgi:hypothetical protein
MPIDCAKIILAATHGELAKVRNATAINGTINALKCKINFRTTDWDNVSKFVVFARGKANASTPSEDIFPPQIIDDENECMVHPGALYDNYFSIGVIGIAENYKIITNWLHFNVECGCTSEGVATFEPPKTIYETILLEIRNHNHNGLYYTKEESEELFLTEEELPNHAVVSINNKKGHVILKANDVGAFANTVDKGVPTIPYEAIINPPNITESIRIDEVVLNSRLKEVLT